MSRYSHFLLSPALLSIPIVVLAIWLFTDGSRANGPVVFQSPRDRATFAGILDLIYRQKYNEAITKLERTLEREPRNGEALTYLATASLYQELNFTKAQKDFKEAYTAGGGATFFVTHSHEKFNTEDVVDYCRGWLHLRADGIEFEPMEGAHGFKSSYGEVEEFKTNRLSRKVFHIKVGEKSQNFRGRTNGEVEPLLIIALYKSFSRN